MAKTWRNREALIVQHANRVSAKRIQGRSRLKRLREFMGHGKGGLYVLWSGKKAIYVGIAGSLRWRFPRHLNDHLKKKWDSFSLYVIGEGKQKYLGDLEALLIRVAQPRDNDLKRDGKFAKHKNITKALVRAIEA